MVNVGGGVFNSPAWVRASVTLFDGKVKHQQFSKILMDTPHDESNSIDFYDETRVLCIIIVQTNCCCCCCNPNQLHA